jgi:hypothetical protein
VKQKQALIRDKDLIDHGSKYLKLNLNNLKVLIVNDESFIVEMMQEIVKLFGIKDIDTAYNGFIAYEMVLKK